MNGMGGKSQSPRLGNENGCVFNVYDVSMYCFVSIVVMFRGCRAGCVAQVCVSVRVVVVHCVTVVFVICKSVCVVVNRCATVVFVICVALVYGVECVVSGHEWDSGKIGRTKGKCGWLG